MGVIMGKKLLLIAFCFFMFFFSISFHPAIKQYTTINVVFEFSKTVSTEQDTREKAVAFHSISFIDSIGNSLGELTFGTEEANELQGSGWFENEISETEGTYQYAGGSTKTADMQLIIPDGTEGLLFYIYGAQDSLWMTVKINGDTSTVLRVDAYWHEGYAPYGSVRIEPLSTETPLWQEGRYFPYFPETDRLYAFYLNPDLWWSDSWNPKWRISQSIKDMNALTLVGMQGVINRNKPRVYLDWETTYGYDKIWNSEIEAAVDVKNFNMDELSIINFLMRRFSNRFNGAVIYDPEVPETINLATMIAGLENRMILAPQQIGLPGIPEFNDVYDLRDLIQQYGWTANKESQTEIYQWVYDNLWQDLEHRIIGIISPGPPTSGNAGDGRNWVIELGSRGYMVALKIPALYLDPTDETQSNLLEVFLSESPSPIPVSGVHAFHEEETTTLISSYGNWQAGFCWPGAVFAGANLSVFSAIRPQIIKYDPDIEHRNIFRTVYLDKVSAMFCTDGDGINYHMRKGYNDYFGWMEVKDQIFGWTINPILVDVAPVVWNYFISSTRNAAFVCALSGVGYCYPNVMDSLELNNYMDYTKKYLEESGLRTIRVDTRKDQWTDELAQVYYNKLKDVGYYGIIEGFGQKPALFNFEYKNTNVPATSPLYSLRSSNEEEVVDNISNLRADEFIYDVTSITPDCYIIEDPDAYNGYTGYIPKEFINSPSATMIFSLGPDSTFLKGEYSVTLRLKVPEIQSTNNVVRFFVSEKLDTPERRDIAIKYVKPTDFSQADVYQDFTLDFELTEKPGNFYVWVDYCNGQTDLFLDYVTIKYKDAEELPVYAMVLIPMMITPEEFDQQTRAPERFTQLFEDSGGAVLTPDEFMAVLNPEYMLGFASQYLGESDSAVVAAKELFDNGRIMKGLGIIRTALRKYLATTNIDDNDKSIPSTFFIEQNYPNPFNSRTVIEYQLPIRSRVKIQIFNILGQEVKTLVDANKPEGYHSIYWDGTNNSGINLSSGVYIYRITTDKGFVLSKKMVYLK